MKLFISCDMEGISGITDPSYINPGHNNYERGRQFMTQDVNAVIEAAVEAGVTEILVADSHNTFNNILLEQLHPKAKLLCGTPRNDSMMEGLDSSYDAAFFIGYHARHGVPGVLSHTMSGVIKNLYVNDLVVGEFGFNAIYAGLCGVPVTFVSGDDQIAQEAKSLIPNISTAIVKEAVSRTSAVCLSLALSHKELQQKTKEALANAKNISPLLAQLPLQCKIEFAHAGQAEMASIVPGTSYEVGSTEVVYQAANQYEMYRTMRAMMNLASSVPFC
ncbi:M55 family metallopeptidase [Brevibacillus ginsengisoli]|uniref:M55 family metallopeptidase n=1 Tax=Brevibacillus ginsengisoli TaxID=363854 RepID=UPI003CF6E65D